MGLPVPASHSRAVWSLLPVRMSLPSGLKATALTQPWWCITVPRGVREQRPKHEPFHLRFLSGSSCHPD